MTAASDASDGARLLRLLARQGDLLRRAQKLTQKIAALESASQSLPPTTSNAPTSHPGSSENVTQDDTNPSATHHDIDTAPDTSTDEFEVPEWSIPIRADVRDFDWEALAQACQFDIICMDPPWQLASHAPTRGVAIGYDQLPDPIIESLPITRLQTHGFIFIWVINVKYTKALDMMTRWGYTYIDDITWVKQTVNRRVAKGHGYYLQHAKETCLVGRKNSDGDVHGDGRDPVGCRHGVASDVIFSVRRGQSQKPDEMYDLMEQLVPNGKYLEIFGRRNNLRNHWVTIGNEL